MTKASRVLAAPEDSDAAGPDNLDLVRESSRVVLQISPMAH